MKKLISIILAITMLMAFVPNVSATETAVTQPQNFTIKYDIGAVLRANYDNGNFTLYDDDKFGFLKNNLEELSNGFFRINSECVATGMSLRYNRGSAASSSNNGFDITGTNRSLILDVFVPVAGNYTMSGEHPHFGNGGEVKVYINGSETEVGSYDSKPDPEVHSGYQTGDRSYGKPEVFEFTDIPLDAGWNTIEFYAVTATGTVRTFSLTLGDGSDYALIGALEKQFTVGDVYSIRTFKSSDGAEITSGLTYESSDANVATVSDGGVITVKGHGTAAITVSDGTRSYDIAIKADNPLMPTILYDIHNFITETTDNLSSITEAASNGFFRFNSGVGRIRHRGSATNRCIDVYTGNYVILDVFVPASGNYIMTGVHPHFSSGGKTYVYVNGSDTAIGYYDSKPVAERHPSPQGANSYGYNESFEFTDVPLNAGWNSLKFVAVDGTATIKTFTLTAGSGNAVVGVFEKEVENGNTASVKAYLSSTGAEITKNISYASDNPSVADVSADGTVTANARGEANITVTYSGDDVIDGMNVLVTKVSVEAAKLQSTVQVYTDALAGGTVIRSTSAVIDNIPVGTPVRVEAIALEGYEFSHWQDSEGKFVSGVAEYSFSPYINTSVIAVFDKTTVEEGDAKTVFFYNGNGEYITEKTTTGDSVEVPENAKLTGYAFDMWTEDGENVFDGTNIAKAITRVVAKYLDEGKTYQNLKINNTDTVVYDAPKSFVDNSATYWKRDGKTVAYGNSYTHYMWDATTIEPGTGEVDEVPVIVIDEHSEENDFYMIEYDLPAGYTKLEAGILFGDDTHKTVESCYYKAKSANAPETAEHGQFTASPSEDTTKTWNIVRGYLIYNDGTTNRVIYAD